MVTTTAPPAPNIWSFRDPKQFAVDRSIPTRTDCHQAAEPAEALDVGNTATDPGGQLR